jgi:hypothetical protein
LRILTVRSDLLTPSHVAHDVHQLAKALSRRPQLVNRLTAASESTFCTARHSGTWLSCASADSNGQTGLYRSVPTRGCGPSGCCQRILHGSIRLGQWVSWHKSSEKNVRSVERLRTDTRRAPAVVASCVSGPVVLCYVDDDPSGLSAAV